MRIDEDPGAATSEAVAREDAPTDAVASEDVDEAEQREKVIVRSNGTVTYVGKDIAYQFWKMGLLGRDFHYREFAPRMDGTPLWATTSDEEARRGGVDPVPAFGGAHATYNVIDTRQTYLQKLLKQALFTMGHRLEAERSTHFAYEMVALTHATARELGYDVSEQADRPFVEVSGRKGLGVKADDLLDRLVEKALEEVGRRNRDLDGEAQRRIATQIAVAALRYFMVKFTRNKVIAFDIDEALSFEGESGPYLQYAAVRAQNIFAKLRDRLGIDEAAVVSRMAGAGATPALEATEADDVWDLVLQCARLDEVAEQALRTLELSLLAKYAFGLAQAFNAFYHRHQILNEEREGARLWRAAVAAYFLAQMRRALDLMGGAVPERM
jgi:arginyl-tRNA synthetase